MFFFGPCIVAGTFRAAGKPDRGTYVKIAGNKEGLWNTLMSLFGMGTSYSLKVMETAVEIEETKLGARVVSSVSIKNVAGTVYGAARNPAYLALSVLAFMGGIGGAGAGLRGGGAAVLIPSAIGFIVGLLLLMGYFMSRRLGIAVVSSGGLCLRLRIKPGRLGRMIIGFDEVADVVDLINSISSGRPITSTSDRDEDEEEDDDDDR